MPRAGADCRRDGLLPPPPGPDPPLHPGRPPRRHALARRGARRVPAQPWRHRPRHLPLDARPGHRRGAPGRRPPRARRRQRRRPAARGAGPAGAGPRAGGRDRRLRHRPARATSPRSRSPGALYVADLTADGAAPRLLDSPGPVVDPRPDPTGTRVAYVSGGALHVHDLADGHDRASSPRRRRTHGHLRARRLRRGRGDGPDARLLVVARTAGRCSSPGSTTPRSTAGTSPTPRTPTASPRSSPTRRPARRTRWSSLVRRRARRHPRRRRMGRRPRRVPGARRVVRRRSCSIVVQPRDQRALRVLQVDPATGATTARARGHRRGTGSRSSPACRPAPASGALRVDHRRRRARAGCSSTASRSRRRPCRCAPCSTSTATPCCSAPPTTRTSTALWTLVGRGRARGA